MSDLRSFDTICRVVYADPKYRARVEWHREYGLGSQLCGQVPRREMEHYVATGEHENPERRITLVLHEMLDFDWWEPRYDQPGRREQTRYREAGL